MGPAEEIDGFALRSCPVDSHQGLQRQEGNKARKLWKTIAKYDKKFLSCFDGGCSSPALQGFGYMPTAVR